MKTSSWIRLALGGLLMTAMLAAGGCDDERYEHRPPPGQGSLIVDNLTGARLDVYVDGALVGDVRSWRDRAWDLRPGVHRLAIRERDFSRYWGGDVDIVAGRRTIAQVQIRPDGAGLQLTFLLD